MGVSTLPVETLRLFHDDCLIQLKSCIVALQYFGLLVYFAIHRWLHSKSSNTENELIPEDRVIAWRLLFQSSGDLMDVSDMFNNSFVSAFSAKIPWEIEK